MYQGRDFSNILQEIMNPALNQYFDMTASRENLEGLPFKDCRSLICRQSPEADMVEGMTEIDVLRLRAKNGINNINAVDTPYYDLVPEVYNEVMKLAAAFRAEQIGRVAVTKLMPGGHVLPHRDFGKYFEHYDRIQIVVGGEGCLFRCGDEVGKMLPGEVWAFNAKEVHEVWNTSAVIRYHIIVDFKLKGNVAGRWPLVEDYADNTEFDVADEVLAKRRDEEALDLEDIELGLG